MKKNPLLKIAAIALGGIVLLWLIQALVYGFGFGYGMGFAGHNYGGSIYMGNGFYFGSSLTYFLSLLIKVFFFLFVLGLIASLIIWVKNNVFSSEEREVIKNTFTSNNGAFKKELCGTCGKELSREWKVCPYCGKSKEA